MAAANTASGPVYEDTSVRWFALAAVLWGVVGMLVGVVIALQLAFPNLFYFPELGWTNFGRLRPLHTSAVIFAFGGNVLIATWRTLGVGRHAIQEFNNGGAYRGEPARHDHQDAGRRPDRRPRSSGPRGPDRQSCRPSTGLDDDGADGPGRRIPVRR